MNPPPSIFERNWKLKNSKQDLNLHRRLHRQYAYRYTIEVWVASFNGICFPAIPPAFLNPRSGQTVTLCNNLLFFVLVLLPTFYDGEGVLRFSEETPISLHVRNLNHKLLMWKLSAWNSPINPAAIRHTRLIVYKFLFILGMPDFSSIPSTTLFFLDGEQRISNFRTWESNPVLSFLSIPIPLDPCSTIF